MDTNFFAERLWQPSVIPAFLRRQLMSRLHATRVPAAVPASPQLILVAKIRSRGLGSAIAATRTVHQSPITDYCVDGRCLGVGRGLGVGSTLGVGVTLGVEVGVAVAVALGVGEGAPDTDDFLLYRGNAVEAVKSACSDEQALTNCAPCRE